MYILGLGCFYHDSSACLLKDGKIVAAAQEERFTREKHDISFPINSIKYCLESQDITIRNIDYIAFYEKPFLKFERLLYQHLEMFPKSYKTFLSSMPSWFTEKLRIIKVIRKKLKYKKDVFFIEHHLAHAAGSFLPSGFKKAAILTIDGVGEWTTTAYGVGKENDIKLLKEIEFPSSLGLLYSTITAYLGFSVNNSEYKVMGLSPYGNMNKKTNSYYKKLKQVIDIKKDGSYRLDMSYFIYHYKDRMPSKKLCKLLEGEVRKKDEEITQRHKDIAAALQLVYEEVTVKILNHVHKVTKQNNLVIAGGCGLNSVLNGKILGNTKFKNIWSQPDPGDGGTCIGAAMYVYNIILGKKRNYQMKDAFLGPEFSTKEIKQFLDKNKIKYFEFKNEKELIERVAKLIYENNVTGWFHGRMEWGPRALGNRSILSNAINPKMKEILNLKVKHRECYDKETEILTKEGWKLFKELNKNEEVATLNPQTNELEYQKIGRRVEYTYRGKMIHFKNKRIDLMVTPNHKIWAKNITNHTKRHSYKKEFNFFNAADLLNKEHIQKKAIDSWKGREEKYFVLPKIKIKKYSHLFQTNKIPMDLWLEFLGYYLSEGCFCYDKAHHYILISQSKKSKHYEKIKKCLNKLPYKWNYNGISFRTSNKQLSEYLKQFGKAKNKFIPRELLNLSTRQLKILFKAIMCGDGTYRPHQYKYSTVSKKLADNIQELGIKLGYAVTTSKEKKRDINYHDMYYVRLNKGSKISWVRKNQSSLKSYNGKVYCVSVPKYHLLCIKRNEKVIFSGNSFRPFAPVVCVEDAKKYFECDNPIPLPTDFMLMVYPIRKKWREKIPSVTHVDGSGRLQTIRKNQNPLYYDLIKEFGKISGIPILINTSFNIRGEPIVCTPYDAYKCTMGTGIDYLIMDKFLIKRDENPQDMWDSEKNAKD